MVAPFPGKGGGGKGSKGAAGPPQGGLVQRPGAQRTEIAPFPGKGGGGKARAACRNSSTNRQAAGVKISAIAQVAENVLLSGERRLAYPGHALAAHLRSGLGAPVGHPGGHVVAAYARHRAAAFGHSGGGIVRAAGAEIRNAQQSQARFGQGILLGFQEGQALGDQITGIEAPDARRNHPRDHRRGQFAVRRQQPVAMRQGPFALLVELADHARTNVFAPIVELFLQLVFDHLALFFHHQNFFQPLGETSHPVGFQRPAHAHLEEANAHLSGMFGVYAQVVQRLQNVEIRLARGDDPQARLGRVDDDLIESVLAAIGQGRVGLVVLHAPLLHQWRIGPAQAEPFGRQRELLGCRQRDLDALGVHIHRGRGLDRVRHRFHRHPAARVARHRPAMHAVIEKLLHAGGVQHRNHRRRKHMIRLVRQGGRLGGMVVAGNQEHTAVSGRAGVIGVFEHVAATIDSRAFAIPHGEHAVVFGAGEEVDLLGAPNRVGREVFVEPRLEVDVGAPQEFLGLPQGLIDPAQRRAAIARNEARGVESGEAVALPLQDEEPHQGLRAGEENPSRFEFPLVVETDPSKRHEGLRGQSSGSGAGRARGSRRRNRQCWAARQRPWSNSRKGWMGVGFGGHCVTASLA